MTGGRRRETIAKKTDADNNSCNRRTVRDTVQADREALDYELRKAVGPLLDRASVSTAEEELPLAAKSAKHFIKSAGTCGSRWRVGLSVIARVAEGSCRVGSHHLRIRVGDQCDKHGLMQSATERAQRK